MSDLVKHHDQEALAEALADIVMIKAHDGHDEFHEDGSVTIAVGRYRKTFRPDQTIGDIRMWYVAALGAS